MQVRVLDKPTLLMSLLVISLILSGCALGGDYRIRNQRCLPGTTPGGFPSGCTTESAPPIRRTSPELSASDLSHGVFVGVTLSGGDSRAANFGAAVLQELDSIGFLDHVAAISSVSGGSLAAAYYALLSKAESEGKGSVLNPKEFWDGLRSALRRNFMLTWTLHGLAPHNLLKLGLTDFDRSMLMAQVFEAELFWGGDV